MERVSTYSLSLANMRRGPRRTPCSDFIEARNTHVSRTSLAHRGNRFGALTVALAAALAASCTRSFRCPSLAEFDRRHSSRFAAFSALHSRHIQFYKRWRYASRTGRPERRAEAAPPHAIPPPVLAAQRDVTLSTCPLSLSVFLWLYVHGSTATISADVPHLLPMQ